QHEQCDRDGEHAVAERLEARGIELVLDPSLFALSGDGPSSYAKTGTASEAIASISAAARSNSSSESTGVPSNGRSRWISSHERQPWKSSRTFTVTGRGMR